MTLKEVMAELETLGNEGVRKMNLRNGSGDNQFGVRMGDLRVLAKRIKLNPELAAELWKTGNVDARLLATLLMIPKNLSVAELDEMVRDANYPQLAEWFGNYILKIHPEKETLRKKWMTSTDPASARAGWGLTAERVAKSPGGLDVPALLDRIEGEMGSAHPLPQWNMNYCLAEIGINHPAFQKRAMAIGEKLGVYRDYPVSKGCTSPFAPCWINEMVKRKG